MRLLLLLLLAASPAAQAAAPEPVAAYRAVFSAEAIGPRPPPSLLTGFTLHYRGAVPHAAFAYALDETGRSAWTFVSGRPTPEAAEADALAACNRRATDLAAPCRILARDGALAGGGPAIVPQTGSIGPFRVSPLHLRRGPEAAQGVVVWGHGYAGADRDNRRSPTPGLVSVLNDAGWDVLRFDRHPGEDALYTSLPRLVEGLPALRAAGYRRIVLGGQSRGGWQAVMAASLQPDLVQAAIAAAPAAHGEAARANNLGAGLEDFRRLLAGLPAEGPRVLVALFEGDDYDPDPERRALMLDEAARSRPAPLLALWPRGAVRGHGGISDWRFTRGMAACVLTFVQAPAAAVPRGLRREPCGGG